MGAEIDFRIAAPAADFSRMSLPARLAWIRSSIGGSMPVTQLVWTWFLHRISLVRNADIPGWVWVVLLWALMAFPAAALRGAHYEEGTVIGLARGAIEDGH